MRYCILLVLFFAGCRHEIFPSAVPAVLETSVVTAVTGSSAVGGGMLRSVGSGAISSRGVCWSVSDTPTIADSKYVDSSGLTDFVCPITGLQGGTIYYARAFATNNGGIAYGKAVSFTTLLVPILKTGDVTDITGNSVTVSAVITNDHGLGITERGFCVGTVLNPGVGDGKVVAASSALSYSALIDGLNSGVIYHVRAYALADNGEVGYGNDISFSTKVVDYDGNVYTTVKIGTQTWMVENYRSTHFTDGSSIDVSYHPDDAAHAYGGNYGWNDVNNASFAPNGWHVPSDAEWTVLYNYINTSGLKIKETGTAHWNTASGTNTTGFTAWGGGHIYGDPLKSSATWWTSTDQGSDGYRWVLFDDGTIGHTTNDKSLKFNVRLIKNN